MTDFNPDDHTAPEVVEELKDATEEEKAAIVSAEMAGKNRSSVLKAADVDPNERRDASGRVLMDHEVAPQDQAGGNPEPEES